MQFLVICNDAPEGREKRRSHLRAHLDYIEGILDRIEVAGPLLDEQGEPHDSCFIYQADNEQEALQLLFDDPYYQNGVYREYHVRPFRGVAGRWVGGKAW